MKFVLIPPGEFTMGSTDEEVAAVLKETVDPPDWLMKHLETEVPARSVRLTKPFYCGVHEVTIDQFRKFVETGYQPESIRDGKGGNVLGGEPLGTKDQTWEHPHHWEVNGEFPVTQVTWNDARAFAEWLSKSQPQLAGYDLPTEAQWEFACRAGSTTRYSTGDTLPPKQLAQKIPVAVGRGIVNPFGLYDMHGNVAEWCLDTEISNAYRKLPSADPVGMSATGPKRMVRGGGNSGLAPLKRSSHRIANMASDRLAETGFRLTISVNFVRRDTGEQANAPAPAKPPFDAKHAREDQAAGAIRRFASDEWIDVMPLLKPELDKVDIGRSLGGKNDWRVEQGELRYFGDDKSGKLYFPVRCLGRSVEWEFEFTRTAGNISFNTDIPVPGGFVPLTIGNDKIGFVNESLTDKFQIVNDQRTKLRLRVTQAGADDRLEVFVSDQPLVDWKGQLVKHKIEPPRTDPRNPSEHLSLFAHGRTNYSFRAIRMRMLNGGTAELLSSATASAEPWIDWLGPKLKRGDFDVNPDGWIRQGEAVTTDRAITGIQVLSDTTRDGAIRLTYLLRDSKGIQINARDRKRDKTDATRELYVAEDNGTQLKIVLGQAGAPNRDLVVQAIPASIPKDAPRTLEFRVVGDTLTATLNGSVVATVKDATIPSGDFALVALKGVLIQKVEYQRSEEPK